MSSKKDDTVYLRHILDAISWINEYLHEITERHLHKNHLIQDGVIRQVGIIGEAAKHVSMTPLQKGVGGKTQI